jgi:hypothetical protein
MANQQYEIQIKGLLSHDWTDWFDGMQMCYLESGETILTGVLADQSALLGILNKLNRLNLPILSVNETDRKDARQRVGNEFVSKSER